MRESRRVLVEIIGIGELFDCEAVEVLAVVGDKAGGEGLVFVWLRRGDVY
jgi:hypothetical protein